MDRFLFLTLHSVTAFPFTRRASYLVGVHDEGPADIRRVALIAQAQRNKEHAFVRHVVGRRLARSFEIIATLRRLRLNDGCIAELCILPLDLRINYE